MDRVFFEELRLPKPDYHLGAGSGSHAVQTGKMLEGVEGVLEKEKPEITIVYGDTNSTLAGALASAKLNIPAGHVEAGLRSYRRSMPEETNRLLTDHLSTLLFCPTAQAVRNLSKEGIRNGDKTVVKNVGDVMYDSVLYYSQLAEKKSTILEDLGLYTPNSCTERFPRPRSAKRGGQTVPYPARLAEKKSTILEDLNLVNLQSAIRNPQYYLATLHRAENTDHPKRLKSIFRALTEIAKDFPVLLPLHPRTKKMIEVRHLLRETRGIKLIDPVSYFDMQKLEKHAKVILTDSGGVQKEAYWFRVPCFTLREETEWVETIQSRWNVLVGSETKNIVKKVRHKMGRKPPPRRAGIFGDGKASEKVVQVLSDYIINNDGGKN